MLQPQVINFPKSGFCRCRAECGFMRERLFALYRRWTDIAIGNVNGGRGPNLPPK
jgi:hypothetical protein